MLTLKLRYVQEDVDRYGNVRVYFRKRGQPKVRLRGKPGSDEFMSQYNALLKGTFNAGAELKNGSSTLERPKPGTWRKLCVDYFSSPTFLSRLDARTQKVRRSLLEATYDELIAPESDHRFSDMPVGRFTTKAVRVLRDRKAATPEAANARLKAIRQVFTWALDSEHEHVRANPARDVPYIKSGSQGFHSWTIEEVEQYETRHPIGTKARLALALLLYLGPRRSDVVLFGRQHVRDGWLKFTAFKGRKRSPVTLSLPILPELQAIIDASPCGDLTFLITKFGKPFTHAGFGNWFSRRCKEAGLQHCSAHGLRKAGAAMAAENGATDHQLMAIFGWKTIKEAQRYTRAARQKVLAGSGMPLLRRPEKGTNVSHSK
jgi:integrase